LIVLSFRNPLDMFQSGSIIMIGEIFRSTKRWELNRTRKVPEFVPSERKKKKKKVRKEMMSVPEGGENKLTPRIETFKKKFNLFRNKWKDENDWVTTKLVDFIMGRFNLWKNKWKDRN
jgi:hypothetical protein